MPKSPPLAAFARLLAVAGSLGLVGCAIWNPAPRLLYPTPVVRHLDGLYSGCAVGGPSQVGDQLVRACSAEVSLTEADLGPEAFKVGSDRGLDGNAEVFAEHDAASVGAGASVFTIKGSDPAQRLAARRGDRLILLTRQPISNAKTLAEVLGFDVGMLQKTPVKSSDYTRLEIYDENGRQMAIEDRAKLAAALDPALASPVDWSLRPAGRRYRVLALTPSTPQSTVYYYPDGDVIVAVVYTSGLGAVSVPARAPAGLRSMLDQAFKEAK